MNKIADNDGGEVREGEKEIDVKYGIKMEKWKIERMIGRVQK